jgi:hypothetical protein
VLGTLSSETFVSGFVRCRFIVIHPFDCFA